MAIEVVVASSVAKSQQELEKVLIMTNVNLFYRCAKSAESNQPRLSNAFTSRLEIQLRWASRSKARNS